MPIEFRSQSLVHDLLDDARMGIGELRQPVGEAVIFKKCVAQGVFCLSIAQVSELQTPLTLPRDAGQPDPDLSWSLIRRPLMRKRRSPGSPERYRTISCCVSDIIIEFL